MGTKGQANVSLLPALGGLFFLVFGRIPYRLWGFFVLSASVVLITIYGNQITPALQKGFSRLDSLALPVLTQTVQSPLSKQVTETQLLEAESLVKTPQGILPFSKKLRVFSTSYDKNCSGCNETTATGLKTGYGVVAVDPRVIPLGTRLYIPGYGLATAGDTGGNIKGTRVDLGFDDVKSAWWSARFVEIYILE